MKPPLTPTGTHDPVFVMATQNRHEVLVLCQETFYTQTNVGFLEV